jgi:5-methylcytosine-specific restriction endonuclease McrA
MKTKRGEKKSSRKNWRSTREYRKWRISCIRRDKVCVICGSRKKRQVHHIASGQYHPEERYTVENGVTLCYPCHKSLHVLFKHSYRVKTTKKDWIRFQKLVKYIRSIDE